MTITGNLTWTAPPEPVTGYRVLRTTDGGTQEEVYAGTALAFDDGTLVVGHVYEYVVEAANQFGASNSNEVTADTRPPTAASLFVSLTVTP